MPVNTNIGWTQATWNPFSGCIKVSEGCNNCYAETLAEQQRGKPAFPNGFDLTLRPHKIRDPISWKKPREIFVNSMSDLFLGTVPLTYMRDIFDTMLVTPRHTYQILTKRPVPAFRMMKALHLLPLPPHIWIGVSVENQRWADERIPQLLAIPAAMRFLSCEPLLGQLDLRQWLGPLDPDALLHQEQFEDYHLGAHDADDEYCPESTIPPISAPIAWVIDGGEFGPNRRPANPDWFRDIRDQCIAAGVPYYHKQGNHRYPGKDRLLDDRTWDGHPNRLIAVRGHHDTTA